MARTARAERGNQGWEGMGRGVARMGAGSGTGTGAGTGTGSGAVTVSVSVAVSVAVAVSGADADADADANGSSATAVLRGFRAALGAFTLIATLFLLLGLVSMPPSNPSGAKGATF